MHRFISRYKYFLLLIPVACLGYWQVAFFQNTLKWDAIDQYYPWRMFVVECLRSGTLPLWNPYEQLGYPIHADPQSGAWYPVVWLFALFGQYSLYSLQTEFMLHIVLGGVGMLLLLESFYVKTPYSFLLACAYMFGGFFIGNAQHITYVVAGCWLPHVFYSYKRMMEELQLKYAVLFALFCLLLVSGGYPAFSIILLYTLLVVFVMSLVKQWKAGGGTIKRMIALNGAAAVMSLLMCSVVVISVFGNGEYLLRSAGVGYNIASIGPFPPQALMSLLLPLAAVKNSAFMDSDISMTTIYVGVLVLVALLFSLLSKKNKSERVLWIATLVYLLAAFGNYTPVRKWMYDFMPLMDLFRFPSIFRVFVMIGFLLLAGMVLSKITDTTKLKNITGVLFLVTASVVFYFLVSGKASFKITDINSLSFYDSILWQAVIQGVFIAALFFVLRTGLTTGKKINLLIAIGIFDLVLAAQLNIPVNVVYSERTMPVAKKIAKKYKHAFTVPEFGPMRWNNDSARVSIQPLWRNTNIFAKKPAWDGYNSFLLNNYLRFTDDIPLRNKIIDNNWAYFSDSITFYRDSILAEQINTAGSNAVFVNETERSTCTLERNTSAFANSIEARTFEPNRIVFNTVSNHKALFTLMQQYFPGWEVFVDGKKERIVVTNYLFMSTIVEKGDHVVEYVYDNKSVRTAFHVSAGSFVLCIGLLLWLGLFQNRGNGFPK